MLYVCCHKQCFMSAATSNALCLLPQTTFYVCCHKQCFMSAATSNALCLLPQTMLYVCCHKQCFMSAATSNALCLLPMHLSECLWSSSWFNPLLITKSINQQDSLPQVTSLFFVAPVFNAFLGKQQVTPFWHKFLSPYNKTEELQRHVHITSFIQICISATQK